MKQLLDEDDRKTLNCLGTHISSQDIQKNRLYLTYYTANGFVDKIFLWGLARTAFSKYDDFVFKNRSRPRIIDITSYSKIKILKKLENFPYLESLDIHPFFKSTDSLELIGNLKNLKRLFIFSYNPIRIPDSIGNLLGITDLGITITQKPFHLPKTFKNLKNVEKFSIRSGISKFPNSPSLKNFPEFILNFKKLTHLSLRTNSLTSLPQSIGNLRNLREMNLYNNELSSLPHSIKNLKNLTRLNIGRNNFTRIPENIKHLKNLESIDISYNPFVSLESFRYLFFNPALTIISDFASSKNYKLSIGGLTIPKEVKNYWHEKNYEGIMQYYTPPIIEIAQKYAHNPKSLTHHELKRLETEVTEKERRILELTLPKNDPILRIINEKLKIELSNGFGLMR
ncbi:leucine-rich repeat domain-containing protein [Promethearchaeum syntrophicum]|uniref:Leucine-rich repeat domain-containing protein n=1 Tax=Promethearchaeum syntrophicum TaxID=2594042 RepID=A0A5B9DAX3_9ARCH